MKRFTGAKRCSSASEQEYQLVIGQEMTLSWSVKNIVTLVLETVTTSGTRVWQGKMEFRVGETEYEEVMV